MSNPLSRLLYIFLFLFSLSLPCHGEDTPGMFDSLFGGKKDDKGQGKKEPSAFDNDNTSKKPSAFDNDKKPEQKPETEQPERGPAPKLKDGVPLLEQFKNTGDDRLRAAAFDKMMEGGKTEAKKFKEHIDGRINALQKEYYKLLEKYIPGAYSELLTRLTDEQIDLITVTRRGWQAYITAGVSHDFKNRLLKPARELVSILMIRVPEITDEKIATKRKLLLELGDYQTRCNTVLEINPDPTISKKLVSPTKIPFPPLDEPFTFSKYLDYMERTYVLACSMAPPEARPHLMLNAENAKDIDVQEAEFVMHANEVRMVVGSVIWIADPLMTPCARDHSIDRVAGKASGHMSTVPGKRGFTDRLKRFGSWGRSEGAGGGRSGPGYLWQLSYGGGHTGPLYGAGPGRNVVGCGRRGGCYTSIYRTEKQYTHPCAAKKGEYFMPPGLTGVDIRNAKLRSIYVALIRKQFGAAQAAIEKTVVQNDLDKTLLKFLIGAVRMELEWYFKGLEAIQQVGDIYELRLRITAGKKAFGTIESFREKIKPFEEHIAGNEVAEELRIGLAYRNMTRHPCRENILEGFIKKYADSVYAEAAQYLLENGYKKQDNSVGPLSFFLTKDPQLASYQYSAKP